MFGHAAAGMDDADVRSHSDNDVGGKGLAAEAANHDVSGQGFQVPQILATPPAAGPLSHHQLHGSSPVLAEGDLELGILADLLQLRQDGLADVWPEGHDERTVAALLGRRMELATR